MDGELSPDGLSPPLSPRVTIDGDDPIGLSPSELEELTAMRQVALLSEHAAGVDGDAPIGLSPQECDRLRALREECEEQKQLEEEREAARLAATLASRCVESAIATSVSQAVAASAVARAMAALQVEADEAAAAARQQEEARPTLESRHTLRGHFVKQGQRFPWTWRQRAFEVSASEDVARPPMLSYYEESPGEAAGTIVKGSLELGNVLLPTLTCSVGRKSRGFELIFEAANGKRRLVARASSEAERERWMTAATSMLLRARA